MFGCSSSIIGEIDRKLPSYLLLPIYKIEMDVFNKKKYFSWCFGRHNITLSGFILKFLSPTIVYTIVLVLVTDQLPEIGFSGTRNHPKNWVYKARFFFIFLAKLLALYLMDFQSFAQCLRHAPL